MFSCLFASPKLPIVLSCLVPISSPGAHPTRPLPWPGIRALKTACPTRKRCCPMVLSFKVPHFKNWKVMALCLTSSIGFCDWPLRVLLPAENAAAGGSLQNPGCINESNAYESNISKLMSYIYTRNFGTLKITTFEFSNWCFSNQKARAWKKSRHLNSSFIPIQLPLQLPLKVAAFGGTTPRIRKVKTGQKIGQKNIFFPTFWDWTTHPVARWSPPKVCGSWESTHFDLPKVSITLFTMKHFPPGRHCIITAILFCACCSSAKVTCTLAWKEWGLFWFDELLEWFAMMLENTYITDNHSWPMFIPFHPRHDSDDDDDDDNDIQWPQRWQPQWWCSADPEIRYLVHCLCCNQGLQFELVKLHLHLEPFSLCLHKTAPWNSCSPNRNCTKNASGNGPSHLLPLSFCRQLGHPRSLDALIYNFSNNDCKIKIDQDLGLRQVSTKICANIVSSSSQKVSFIAMLTEYKRISSDTLLRYKCNNTKRKLAFSASIGCYRLPFPGTHNAQIGVKRSKHQRASERGALRPSTVCLAV